MVLFIICLTKILLIYALFFCHDKSIRNNFPSSPLIRYFLDGTALTLISVELQDMGKFSCVAINDVQVMESSANLLVIGKFWIF